MGEARDEADRAKRASHTAQPRSAFGGTVTYPIAMPPLIITAAKVHSADESQVGAKNGGGIYRWPEFRLSGRSKQTPALPPAPWRMRRELANFHDGT